MSNKQQFAFAVLGIVAYLVLDAFVTGQIATRIPPGSVGTFVSWLIVGIGIFGGAIGGMVLWYLVTDRLPWLLSKLPSGSKL